MNRLGQRGETDLGWNSAAYAARARAFGWHAIELDGHDLAAIDRAYAEALSRQGPADRAWSPRRSRAAASRSSPTRTAGTARRSTPTRPRRPSPSWAASGTSSIQTPKPENAIARRGHDRAAAEAADLRRSAARRRRARPTATPSSRSARAGPTWSRWTPRCPTRPTPTSSRRPIPDRFFEMFIAEQQMLGAAVGLGVLGKKAVRLDLRRLLHARLRPDPHGGDLQRHHPPERLARRRQHRRGRPVADGPGRPGHDAGRLRQHGALPVRRQPDGRSWSSRWPT